MHDAREEKERAEAQLAAEKEVRERAGVKAQQDLEQKVKECQVLEASLEELKGLLAQATEKASTLEVTQASCAAAEAAAAERRPRGAQRRRRRWRRSSSLPERLRRPQLRQYRGLLRPNRRWQRL